MNISFILESCYRPNGMERMFTTIASSVGKTYNVTAITAFNEGRKDFFTFADEVKRVDLGMRRNDYHSGFALKKEYKKRLASWLQANHQDVVVSLGSTEFFFLPDIKDGSKKVFWFHFAFNFDVMTSRFTSFGWFNRLIGNYNRKRRINIARKYDKMVVLSKHDLSSWGKYLDNVVNIYNPITIKPKSVEDYSVKRVIAVGRLEYQKGFDLLVEAWASIRNKIPNWQLDIYGTSIPRDVQYMKDIINSHGLQGVINLKGRTENIADAYASHSIMVMSSRYEGFGLVLVEAAACGLPLVAFDCEQGPSEIIDDGKNGFLVSPVGNIKGLADAILKLTADEELRRVMGARAKKMAEEFSLDKVTDVWNNFFLKLNS